MTGRTSKMTKITVKTAIKPTKRPTTTMLVVVVVVVVVVELSPGMLLLVVGAGVCFGSKGYECSE